jgi:hypothetical protein
LFIDAYKGRKVIDKHSPLCGHLLRGGEACRGSGEDGGKAKGNKKAEL